MLLQKLSQRAALFGMDARIALVAMGVAATAISVMTISGISENKVYTAEKQLAQIKANVFRQCEQASGCVTDITDSNLYYSSDYGYNSANDPWDNPFQLFAVSVSTTISGETAPVMYYVIVSNGPDGVFDSSTVSLFSDWNGWSPQNDDIGIKFSTVSFARNEVLKGKKRVEEIAARLKLYESFTIDLLRNDCDIPANQLLSRCDFNGNGAYVTDEEFQSNFFPKSTGEATALKYYDPSGLGTTYTSGNSTSMTSLLQLITYPYVTANEYATDKLGRVLRYTSNATGATVAPFTARFWYQ